MCDAPPESHLDVTYDSVIVVKVSLMDLRVGCYHGVERYSQSVSARADRTLLMNMCGVVPSQALHVCKLTMLSWTSGLWGHERLDNGSLHTYDIVLYCSITVGPRMLVLLM